MESSSCGDLAGAAAVTLGLILRDEVAVSDAASSAPAAGDATTRASSPNSTNPSEEPPEAIPVLPEPPREPTRPREASPGPSSGRLVLRLPLLGVDVGPLPRVRATLGLAVGVRFEPLELTLGARMGTAQTIRVQGSPVYGAKLSRATLELRGCREFRLSRLGIAPCLLLALDRVGARGVGDQVLSQTRYAFAAAVGLGALARFRLSDSWALVASLGGQLEASRVRVLVDGLGEVTQLSPLAFSGSGGIEWSP